MYAADHSMQIMSADGQPTEAAEPEDDDGAEIDGADDEQRGLPWCRRGELFKASAPGGSGASAGDVVQGALGDCWFLGALSVLATNERQLTKVFWPESNPEQFRDQVTRGSRINPPTPLPHHRITTTHDTTDFESSKYDRIFIVGHVRAPFLQGCHVALRHH